MHLHHLIRRGLGFVALFILLFNLGCGSGDNRDTQDQDTQDNNTQDSCSATGALTLPEGVAISKSDLKVLTAGGTVSIDAGGAFTAPEPEGGPALVAATDAAGKLVLLGHVDADNPGFGEINVRSTAIELLFTATMACMLPVEQWPRVYELLASAPETDTLAAVIAQRMAVNPTALGDEDPEILAAVDAARATLAPLEPSEETSESAGTTVQRLRVEVTRRALTGTPAIAVNVVSENPPGLIVAPSEDGQGITVQNWFRIHRRYFVYRTGSGGATGVQPLDPWQPVETSGFLSSVSGVTSFVGALCDYYIGDKKIWSPKISPVIPLPRYPPEAEKNTFEVIVVGAGNTTAVPFDLQGQPIALSDIQTGLRNMELLELAKEMVLPMLFRFLPTGKLAKAFDRPETVIAFASSMANTLLKGGIDVATAIRAGDMRGAFSDAMKAIIGNPTIRKEIFANGAVLFEAGGLALLGPEAWGDMASKITAYLRITDIVLTSSDVGKVLYDISRSNQYNTWAVNAIIAKAHISPKTSTVREGAQQNFHVNVEGGLGALGTLEYTYSCSKGTLADDRGHSGKSFDSSQPDVQYTAPSEVQDGDSDTVTVSVRLNVHSTRYDVGTDSATVTLTRTLIPIEIWPKNPKVAASDIVEFSILGTDPSLGTYEYEWSLSGNIPGTFCDEEGHRGSPFTNSSKARFETSRYLEYYHDGATATVSARVTLFPLPGQSVLVGTVSTTITVRLNLLEYSVFGDGQGDRFWINRAMLRIYVAGVYKGGYDAITFSGGSQGPFKIMMAPGDVIYAEQWGCNYGNSLLCEMSDVYISGPGLGKTLLISGVSVIPDVYGPGGFGQIVSTGGLTLPQVPETAEESKARTKK